MVSGRSMQLTKQIGEYLVAAELCRRGLIATTFTGNVPDFDILAINEKYITIPVQVKTIKKGNWQFDAGRYIKIEIDGDIQKVTGKTDLSDPTLVHIFVKLIDHGRDEFYIFELRDLQDIIFNGYQNYLLEKKGIRPKNPKSKHVAIWPKQLTEFKDNWKLIQDREIIN